ncbi:heavy metal translocating P-type ATPase [Paradevosia shaoguanensis]|uniref:P-type Zn(2+) transporter n=1 Tax=Paradevosia shaoguanensis TaxID=1335043 RepID=A0AA41QJ01_9HYPH|nr:heavy metal translocating P-type ATPase [Paradevosia shaoguanensis]MCF1741012.1 cadmium-translocating P-type ATPase [Paradevosia shaoguanensis]MCI0125495.1 cadmium-translocating P-type ATPase [Paradevosia shaoguanensis]
MDEKLETRTLNWRVEGMDCASCAAKIRTALERMPGVSDVAITHTTEKLSLKLAEGGAAPEAIEKQISQLGYAARPFAGAAPVAEKHDHDHAGHDHAHDHGAHDHSHGEEPGSADKAWWQTRKGQLVIVTGVLYALAWVAKLAFPDVSYWAFVVATLLGVAPVAMRAFQAARTGSPFTIEMLMTIAATGALVIGAAEEAALVVFLFAVGEVLEGAAAAQARASIKALGDLVPKTALVEENGQTQEVQASALRIGQTVLVRPGDRIPADGIVISGLSGVDQSPVTGESVPVMRGEGDEIFAGSINKEAALRIRVDKAAADNTIARIIKLVEEANEARAPTERFIDRFSRWYMPAIVGVAVLVTIVPPLLGLGDWWTWLYRGLTLLLIGCPCALVISVPASIASALAAGARQGLLLKGGVVIETVAKTRKVAFDKTGTLTRGEPKVTDVVALSGSEDDVLRLAAAVEAGSSHPLAQAILNHAKDKGIVIPSARDEAALVGKGVEATVEGARIFVGTQRDEAALPDALRLEGEGKTVSAVVRDGTVLGLIALRDEPREDAKSTIAALSAMDVGSVMLTGDNERTAAAIAGTLGMDYRAQLMPEDKVSAIKSLGDGVMMVGDGINDAPALAAASTGIAMGSGTDVALETADGALLRSRITDVVNMIGLSRATMSNIGQNITVALGLKAIFLVTSVFGITGLWIAILADTGATVLVTANALRLLGWKGK